MSFVSKILKKILSKPALLSYTDLVELIELGVIDAPLSAVNGSSIDLTLHHIVRKEAIGSAMRSVRLGEGESIDTEEINMCDGLDEYTMMPDSVLLGSTAETFNMPLWLSAEYSLKSTLGRNFLSHENAGWIDPGFSGKITLELKNHNQFHKLILAPDIPIGQVKFFRHAPVPEEFSYRKRGQYNGQSKVRAAGILT